MVDVQRLQLRRFQYQSLHRYSIVFNETLQKVPTTRCYSTEQTINTTDAAVEPKRTLKERLVAYFRTTKSVRIKW